MAVEELIPSLLSAALLIASVITFSLLAKNRTRGAELRRDIFRARRTKLVFVALLLLGTFALNGILGLGFIGAGRPIGWAFVLLAPVPLVFLSYLGFVAKLPLPPQTEPEPD